MKKNFFIKFVLVFCLFLTNHVMAQNQDGTCDVLGFHEPGTNIYNGPTFCHQTSLSTITVRGPLRLEQTVVAGKTDVSGPIKANNSTLNEVVLENNKSVEKVMLTESSVVNGNITFLGLEGLVYLDASSSIKGKVVNGKVVKQSK